MLPSLPQVVSTPMEELLASFDQVLQQQRPEISELLNPGISAEAQAQIEAELGVALHPEIQQWYRWHNGIASGADLFPGYSFMSLGEAVRTNRELRRAYQEAGISEMMAHEDSWLVLFPDGAGDGYYYDPARPYEAGGVFFHFRESDETVLFPSIRNLLAAIIECWNTGVYEGEETRDFVREQKILHKFGVAKGME